MNIATAQYAPAIAQPNGGTMEMMAPTTAQVAVTPVSEAADFHARGFVLGGILALGLWILLFSAAQTVMGLFQI